MKRTLLAAAIALLSSNAVAADSIKVGILFGFTGPLESWGPGIEKSAEMAFREVNESGALLNGSVIESYKADDTCVDAAAATAAAQRLVTSVQVSAIVGGSCSGVTGAVLQAVLRPSGVVMISSSATSSTLSSAEDDGLFFRTVPSDTGQGPIIAEVIMERGINSVALTYVNNDFGKGLAESFMEAYKEAGGTVSLALSHLDGKADYSAEIGSLSSAGGDLLVVIGYVDEGGKGIVQAALDAGAFSKFYFPPGMSGDSLLDLLGSQLDGTFGSFEGTDGPGAERFAELAEAAGFDSSSPYAAQTYDAAALVMLAMQAAGSSEPSVFKHKVMEVANGPGEKIYTGELAKGLQLLSQGKPIDYVGATDVELIGPGDAAGSYRIYTIKDGKQVTDYYK